MLRSVALLALAAQAPAGSAAPAPAYDLLIRNGHVVDPANDVDGRFDVAVRDGKIAAVARKIPAASARDVVDAGGLVVTPGLVDIHAHVYVGLGRRPSHPADLHLAAGVTTIVDAGTWGAKDFHVMREHVASRARVRVLALLNISAGGMERDGAEQDVAQMDAKLCADTVRKHRDVIVGVKTAHYWTRQPWDAAHPPWASVDRALECGRQADVPIMVDFWPRPPERPYDDLILKKLRPGDMHTHVFAQQFPVLEEGGRLNPALLEARKRGVLFDLGHGAASFWFRNAAPAIKQGFLPDSISTDLHQGSAIGPVVDMTMTLSKIHALGVPLREVIRRATVNPARQIKRPELGTLGVGRDADIAILEVRRGRFGYSDCGRAKMIGNAKIENRLTVRAGRIVYDPTGLSFVEWRKAPPPYWVVPKLQAEPPPEPAAP
jgi:dihydroorotase